MELAVRGGAPARLRYRFRGYFAAFEGAGFREVERAGTRRHVMRLEIAPPHGQ